MTACVRVCEYTRVCSRGVVRAPRQLVFSPNLTQLTGLACRRRRPAERLCAALLLAARDDAPRAYALPACRYCRRRRIYARVCCSRRRRAARATTRPAGPVGTGSRFVPVHPPPRPYTSFFFTQHRPGLPSASCTPTAVVGMTAFTTCFIIQLLWLSDYRVYRVLVIY